MNLTELYLHNYHRAHDINEHLPYLAGLALKREVVELGFRTGRSTSAFLLGGATKVTAYDTQPCNEARGVFEKLAPDRFTFIQGNSLEVEIPPCHVLFIDSYHSGEQLLKELRLHFDKVRDMIVLHDTATFGHVGEGKTQGLQWAIRKFVCETTFKMHVHFPNNNGLTVLA
jgi:hypothetical protein